MGKIVFGNHASVLVPRRDRDDIRKFYCDVLGGEIMKADPERDFIRLGGDFFIGFLYGDVADESLRLVGIGEDLSFYEGTGAGPDVTKVKEAVQRLGSA